MQAGLPPDTLAPPDPGGHGLECMSQARAATTYAAVSDNPGFHTHKLLTHSFSLAHTCCFVPSTAELAAQEAARRAAYLQLDLPPPADGADGDGTSSCSCLLWVDDADGCRRALQALSGSSAIGLDVEWRPSHVAGVTSPAALLQVRLLWRTLT